MPAPLLTTKLRIPPPGKSLVDRPRLVNKLNECLQPGCKLALISAPAGFGKSTLVSTWINQVMASETLPYTECAWLALDDGDNDPVLFWLYVISSIQVQHLDIGKQTQTLLQQSNPPDVEAGLAILINELAQIPHPMILAMDDYHLVRNPAIHQSLSYFIEHIPPQFHVMLLSRTDPPLPLALLRGRRQLLEMRMDELRFSIEDAFFFLNSCWGLNLSESAIRMLHTKTDGWAAGLQMAAISMQGRRDPAQFIRTFSASNRYILEYLVEEVLNRQAEYVKDFLLNTSILDSLCAPLCEALYTSPIDSQSLISFIEHSNLFLVPLDDDRQWYRYHALFGELLRNQLERTHGDIVLELHRRAAAWLEANNNPIEAVRHLLAANESQHAAQVVEAEGTHLLSEGKANQVMNWLNSLPGTFFSEFPRLNLLYSWGLISTGKFNLVEPHLVSIEQHLGGTQELEDLRTEIDATRATIAFTSGNYSRAIQLGEKARVGLSKSHHLYSGVLMGLGTAYRFSGNLKLASQILDEASTYAEKFQYYASAVGCLCNLGDIYLEQGLLRLAKTKYQHAIGLIQRLPWRTPVITMAYLGLCRLYYEWDEQDKALQSVCEALNQVEAWGNVSVQAVCEAYKAMCELSLGKLDEAERSINSEVELGQKLVSVPFVGSTLRALNAQYYLHSGRPELARQELTSETGIVQASPEKSVEEQLGDLSLMIYLGQRLDSSQDLSKALDQINSLAPKLFENDRIYLYVQMQAQKIMALSSLGKVHEAEDMLSALLDLVEPEGYIRTFVDLGLLMANLIQQLATDAPDREYVRRLQAAFKLGMEKTPKYADTRYGESLTTKRQTRVIKTGPPELLSARETEILRLISEGLSNKEIAQKLCISLRTVKYHTTSIYNKLNATGRAHAVAKARQLNLL